MHRAYWSSGTSATPPLPRCVRALLGSVLVLAEDKAGSLEDDSLDAGGKKVLLNAI